MIEIDATLVKRLIRTQFPQWAELPVVPVENNGWDNRTFHLGDKMSVRLPSAPAYAAQVAKEHRWLPALRLNLPMPIPVPLGLGAPGSGYPWPWSIYGWLEGEPRTPTASRSWSLRRRLGRIPCGFARDDAHDGPVAGTHSSHVAGHSRSTMRRHANPSPLWRARLT